MGTGVSAGAPVSPSIHPRLGRLAVCDHVHRGTVRYVMVRLVVTAYTALIDCG